MQRTMLLIILSLLCFGLFAETVTLGSESNALNVLHSSDNETVLQYKIGTFEKESVQIDGEKWFHVSLPKEGHSQDKGFPQLPVFNRSIVIPGSSAMHLEVYDIQYEDITLPIAPSKGVITRIYTLHRPYTLIIFTKTRFLSHRYRLSEPYIMRDFVVSPSKPIPCHQPPPRRSGFIPFQNPMLVASISPMPSPPPGIASPAALGPFPKTTL